MAKMKTSNYLIGAGLVILLIASMLIFGGITFAVFELEAGPIKIGATGITAEQAFVLVVGFGLIGIGLYAKKQGT